MLSRKALALASLSTIVCTQAGIADDGFKSSKFLTYPEESQRGYITSSAMMAGMIATQNQPGQAKCVDEWATTKFDASFRTVVGTMKLFPDHHPTAVILAVLQQACGSFKY
jgi:hypothetical protein